MRSRWYPWTSRAFCSYCAPKSIRKLVTAPIIATVALIGGGILIGRSMRQQQPAVIIESSTTRPVPLESIPTIARQKAVPQQQALAQAQQTAPETQAAAPSTTASEATYMCGAMTKKGTICTRHVHGNVRCFQHKGMPAALPPEQLLVKR